MKKTSKSILILVTLIILLSMYLINANLIIKEIINYSILFLTKLFPVSFLFFIISGLLIKYGLIQLISKYLNLNTSSLYIFILSLLSGFPSGSKYTKELYNEKLLEKEAANNILMCSHFPNPLFIFGTVNLVIKDHTLTLKLYCALFLSNLLIFIFMKKSHLKFNYNYVIEKDFSTNLSLQIKESFNTMLLIYGTSLFFYLIAVIIIRYLVLDSYTYIFINGLFDLTKGILSTSILNNSITKVLYILFFISFGGISIHMQVKSILTDTDLNYYYFLKGRIVGTVLAFIIFVLTMLF